MDMHANPTTAIIDTQSVKTTENFTTTFGCIPILARPRVDRPHI
jgi:hypothetical protein